jgi:hypothetical protein
MRLWMAFFLFFSQGAFAALHPFSLVSPSSEEKLSPLSEIKFDQLVQPDQRLSDLEMKAMDSATWDNYLALTRSYFPLPERDLPGPLVKSSKIPPTLLESGRRFREVKRIAALRPEFTLEAYEFFSQCSENKEILETINALCLGHAWSLAREHQLPFEVERYPKEWLELASLTFAP